ncbi:MAG: MFS transporter [Sporocytophaga sp.]|uniref:MFS transporter n=1 Tax=Sporocytophaga sp. TaxID=2231183 RepID=UPI001B2E1728|nr:MFS transporter [Sporocytophaga sp.]MBO9699194.1 MFS transporter [Sporocytophaga sp.]
MNKEKVSYKDALNLAVIVAALGYFVDVYDLVLFLIVGLKSLEDLKIPGEPVKNFQFLLNVQMIGMLIGGIFWGVLGDKKGRLSVLFGSILLYSLANLANGMVAQISEFTGFSPMETYAVLRFLAGLGLAGELGAGITLVSETMPKETRGYGTMIIASVGVTGAVVAALVGKIGWELSYFIGGGLGISLLLLRIGVFESGMFQGLTEKKVKQGEFMMLFQNKERAIKYLNCILIGLPVWFIIGILIGRAGLIAKELGVQGKIEQGYAVMLCYGGLVFGDLCSGMMSQALKSRKKVFYFFYLLSTVIIVFYLRQYNASVATFYMFIFSLGFSVGFWAIFVTVASEQFGTNIRATVTTTVPNFVRGSLVPISILFDYLLEKEFGLINTSYIVTGIIIVISLIALYNLDETFGKDLDYLEDEESGKLKAEGIKLKA